ncbi:MAG: hypothetical protein QGH62_03855 [Nitrospinaceae bacterium]|jgi:hypothetical protein|nr:hypothetical protein [Nitrospinaceae bacterium]
MINRIIPLLLFIGFVWGQADLDKLVLKDGTTYFGEYSKIQGKIVFFKPQDAFAFQPVPVKQIERLELKDGHFIIVRGYTKKIPLAIEEYQKLSTKEKALHDAKLINLGHWGLYGPLSGFTFWGCVSSYQLYNDGEVTGLLGGEWWESSIFLGGSSAASLTIPYFVLNKEEKFSYPESLANEYDRLYYKKVYYKNINKRKTIIIMASSAITAGVVGYFFATLTLDGLFSSGGNLKFEG